MIKVVTFENFESLMALMKKYQAFYEVVEIDEKKNEEFFSKFIGGVNEGDVCQDNREQPEPPRSAGS